MNANSPINCQQRLQSYLRQIGSACCTNGMSIVTSADVPVFQKQLLEIGCHNPANSVLHQANTTVALSKVSFSF